MKAHVASSDSSKEPTGTFRSSSVSFVLSTTLENVLHDSLSALLSHIGHLELHSSAPRMVPPRFGVAVLATSGQLDTTFFTFTFQNAGGIGPGSFSSAYVWIFQLEDYLKRTARAVHVQI